MQVFDITRTGLVTIGLLVSLLWSVLLLERDYNRQVQRDYDAIQESWRIIPAVHPEPSPATHDSIGAPVKMS